MPSFSTLFSRLKNYFFVALLIALFSSFGTPVLAAEPKLVIQDKDYSAKFVSQSIPDPVVMYPGERKTITLTFKNTGKATWGPKYFVSAYTVEPKYRASAFRGKNWLSNKQTGKIPGTVKPGQNGTLSVELVAPSIPGEHVERFYLSAENRTWIQGGFFFLTIRVVPKSGNIPPSDSADSSPKQEASNFKADVVVRSKKKISVKGGEEIPYAVVYKNIGKETWQNVSLAANEPSMLASAERALSFAHESWKSRTLIEDTSGTVAPQTTVRKQFSFRAPAKQGIYTAQFSLTQNGKTIEGSQATVEVTVTEDAPEHFQEPFSSGTAPIEVPRLSEEPKIRVGIWNPEGEAQFQSDEDDYDIYFDQEKIGTLPRGTLARMIYKNGSYMFKGADFDITRPEYIRLVPVSNMHAVYRLPNFDRKVSWKGPKNFNAYRGVFEYRLTKDASKVYGINELLFEDYVAGIAENANNSPIEYLRAQAVAQRTYAYYIKDQSTKHDSRYFDVVATTGDQLYLGYESELIMSRFVEAAQSTRGIMVTYNNEVVITPYFGNADTRTRSWTEVWGGSEKPWLVPVATTYDARDGKKLYGHGVGMSQRDAAVRAEEEQLDWQTLLKYYYTGTTMQRIYP